MPDLSLSGITGTDGKVPVYEPDGRWTTWSLAQIFIGTVGEGRYVPKVDDYVVDTETDERYIVASIDPTTMVAVLRKIVPSNVSGVFSDTDLLLGVGPGTQSDTYRIYIDQSVIPHTLAVDARLKVNGSMVTSCKIFKGSELSGNLAVISAMYDQSGNLLGQTVPLELVVMANQQNLAVKSVPVCYTSQALVDGEVVTAVFYSDTGHVVSKRQLLVENTAFIRSSNVGTKYVTDISLECPFLSQADPQLIQYPINVPLNSLNLMGVVHYSDGSTLRMPVDGQKFAIFGLENFAATIVGQKVPLVLKYSLSPGEVVYGSSVGSEHFIAKSYRAQTQAADGIYSVKLFGYPVWIDAVNGYRMEWFLYNLERSTVYRATPYVRFNDNTAAFNPIAYGTSQRLSVSVNLKDVNPVFRSYIHVQTIDIVLLGEATIRDTNWTVGFEPGQNPPYGRDNFVNLEFINQNLRKLKLDMGAVNITEWLNRAYYASKPLVDITRESLPPTPDFFSILIGNTELEFPIAQWNQEISLSQVIGNNDTLFVKFFKRTVENDLQLAIAGIPIWQQT